jgi:predicted O-methyltransferase YrrM
MIKKALSTILRKTDAGSRLLTVRSLAENGYLKDKGWIASVISSLPLDASGQPLPWYTYGAIDFLAGRVNEGMRVFEYGSGNSTLWWSRQTRHVVSCEHDKSWYDLMKGKVPPNVDYMLIELDRDGRYANAVAAQREPFDVIVIDGRDRVKCAEASLPALKPDGVIVWDNSDRPDYDAGYRFLLENGFKRLDFWGMGPINAYGWCTSVFYRPQNCFEI